MLFILTFHSSKNTEKVFLKLLNSKNVFNIDINKKTIEQKISILEWFLNDHVKLKTEAMMLKISFAIIHYILK